VCTSPSQEVVFLCFCSGCIGVGVGLVKSVKSTLSVESVGGRCRFGYGSISGNLIICPQNVR
jgi:hypothetical protein